MSPSFVRTLELGSLASCPTCGGLTLLRRYGLGYAFLRGALWRQHLTGDAVDQPCSASRVVLVDGSRGS